MPQRHVHILVLANQFIKNASNIPSLSKCNKFSSVTFLKPTRAKAKGYTRKEEGREGGKGSALKVLGHEYTREA